MLLYFKCLVMLVISLIKFKKIGVFLYLVYFSILCFLLLLEYCGLLREDYCFYCREVIEV